MQGLFDWINLLLALIGVVPILISVYYFWGNLTPVRRFFNFNKDEPIDIILTTSQITRSSKGARVVRATTGIGQIEGTATVSRFLGQYYQQKPLKIELSTSVHQRLKNDLVIFGGPAKNEISKQFLLHLKRETPIDLEFDDINIFLRLGDLTISTKDIVLNEGLPKNDYAVVVAWHNPFAIAPKRCIFCAGFTSYGTSGAGSWLFNDLPKQKNKSIYFKRGKEPNFITILEIELVKDTILSVRPIKTLFFDKRTNRN